MSEAMELHSVKRQVEQPESPSLDATPPNEIITRPRSTHSNSTSASASGSTSPSISPRTSYTGDSSLYSSDDGHDDAMPSPATSNRAETRWTVRIMPFVILAALAYATYAVVAHLCIDYLLRQKKKTAVAIVLLVLYFIIFILTVASYLRCFLTIQFNTGFVPLSTEREALDHERKETQKRGGDVEALTWVPPDQSPDSPGLEAFYSKDVFVCELDGRPKWCSECRAWKPDRAHHSSELERCVRKMDHLCPWVGGMVSETSFNFFVQFTYYCTFFCAMCIATTAYSFRLQQRDGQPTDVRLMVALALSSFLGFFSLIMAFTAFRFVFTNITNIDMFRKQQTFRLAVRVPQSTQPTDQYQTITYPLTASAWGPNGPEMGRVHGMGQVDGADHDHGAAPESLGPVSTRDRQAQRKFAILTTEPGENPWDVGPWRNFKSVMGNSIIEWLLPIRHSPCCNHDSMVSDYEFGPLIEELKRRYGITEDESPANDGIEMQSAEELRR
ncbi:hypothetical protein FZEAL_4845 [Fusarium zealandicum]|uniref:Palmitoyltransferase n=1 Tax=Fusarium zealandicum TaxID=1053134 RepID=A0A8H4UKW7_9HYPO|nr:hypothetical protein FZEAL_4845 [Fusarium zealandicum]